MSDVQRDFADFMQQRQAAAMAYVNGDAKLLDQITTRTSPASFFGPRGGHEFGANDVASTYQRDAAMFEGGSETHLEILHMSASDGFGYWVGLQHAHHGSPCARSARVGVCCSVQRAKPHRRSARLASTQPAALRTSTGAT